MAKVNYTGGQILTDARTDLKKTKFSLFAMTLFIYCACAGGAFGIEEMISSAGPGSTLILLLVIPILWALPIGLYSSELTNLAPVQSGPYVWAKMAFGEFWGFSFGFWLALAFYLTGPSYIVLAANYMGLFFEMTPAMAFVIKAAIIIVFTVVNLMGLEEVSTLSTIFSVVILVAFAAVTFVGFAHWQYNPMDPIVPTGGNGALSSWGTGISVGIWMYCGYIGISALGGEIENPQIIPKGMKISIFIIVLSYFLPTLAGIVSTGPWSEWGISLNYSSVLTEHVGKWAGMLFMVSAVIAQFAIFNAAIASASRAFMGLCKDNLCPKFLSNVSKNRKVPVIPIILLGIVNLILVNLDFSVLVNMLSPILFVIYVGLGFAYAKIRKDYPVEKRGNLYYVKSKLAPVYIAGGPLLVGVISYIVNGTEYFLLAFAVIIAAVVFYPIFKWVYGGYYKNDPENNPINPRTKLAQGDIGRFGSFFLIFGAFAFIGSFLLVVYQGGWGSEYYIDTYGSGFMSNFWLMIKMIRWLGVVMLALGAVLSFVGKKYDPIPE